MHILIKHICYAFHCVQVLGYLFILLLKLLDLLYSHGHLCGYLTLTLHAHILPKTHIQCTAYILRSQISKLSRWKPLRICSFNSSRSSLSKLLILSIKLYFVISINDGQIKLLVLQSIAICILLIHVYRNIIIHFYFKLIL